MWAQSDPTNHTYQMQLRLTVPGKSTVPCLVSMTRPLWCHMYQRRNRLCWHCQLCTMMTKQMAQKPEIILYYNSTKSGVDNLDHLATMYTCRRKAAFIIWMGNFPQWKISEGRHRRCLFLSELANQLIMPYIRCRALTPNLQPPIRNAMKIVGIDLPPLA